MSLSSCTDYVIMTSPLVSSCGFMFCVFWQKFEKKYNSELAKGAVSKETKFEYAWCLIRSKYTQDIKKGVVLLEGETSKYIQW